MPPLVPSFLLPQWLNDAPTPIKLLLLGPGLLVGAVLGIAVNAIMVNLGAGNQHLSDADGGFEWWLIWGIVAAGLLIGLGVAAFVYFAVGVGADEDLDDDGDAHGETGLLEG